MKEPTLERWFAERAARLEQPRSGFEEMLAAATTTPQQRYRWLPAGVGPGQARVPLAAATAVAMAAIALASLGILAPSTPVEDVAAPLVDDAVVPVAEDTVAPTSDEPAPVAATESDAVTTFETVTSAGLQTEPLAAGIAEVVRDGANHGFKETHGFAIGADGRAWASREDRMIQVGAPGVYTADEGAPKRAWEVWTGADGRPFTRAAAGVFTLDAGRWVAFDSIRPDAPGDLDTGSVYFGPSDFEWQPTTTTTSGEVWGVASPGVVQLDGDDWVAHAPSNTGIEWPGGLDTDAFRAVRAVGATDGSVWAEIRFPADQEAPLTPGVAQWERSTIVRYDGDSWDLVMPRAWLEADGGGRHAVAVVTSLLPAADGSMLVAFINREGFTLDAQLARWDGTSWTGTVAPSDPIDVAADGAGNVWYLVEPRQSDVLNLYRYDGTDWVSRELPSSLPRNLTWSLDAAPDGTLWLHGQGHSSNSRLFVLDPLELGFK